MIDGLRQIACMGLVALLAGCASSPPERSAVTWTPDDVRLVEEAWQSMPNPADNVDSPASWLGPDGQRWVFLTAKSSDLLVLFDADSGEQLRRIGGPGRGAGEFDRPNGIFVIDDLLLVVERDNRRVQLFRLPELVSIGSFGQGELRAPYGLWAQRVSGGLEVLVSDSFMYGEKYDVVPPLAELGDRFRRYRVQIDGNGVVAEHLGPFGATTVAGAIRIPESLWGDPVHNRLLLAEEDAADGTRLKIYDFNLQYSGQDLASGLLQTQAEGVTLWQCADGSGYWIITDQHPTRSIFHLFDRQSLAHLGAFSGPRTGNTDGIWLRQSGSPRFPAGVFFAVHDDRALGAFDWRDIARALDLRERCPAG